MTSAQRRSTPGPKPAALGARTLVRAGMAIAALTLSLSLPGALAQSQGYDPKHPFGSAAERRERMATKAATAFYTKAFDLSGLPAYVPEQRVAGTLRIAGNNYVGDSPLASWWAEGFRKHHPGVEFDFNLPSTAIAIPALYFGTADLAMNHEPSFYDLLGHLRITGHEPMGISALTGSYDVRGWQNTIVIAVHESNPLTKITMQQLDGVFGSVRAGGWSGTTWHPEFARGSDQDVRTWGQLGLAGEWAERSIDAYGYAPRYATAIEFSNRVLKGSDKWNGDLLAFANYRRPDGTIYGQATQVTEFLKANPAGIAYLRYDRDFPAGLRVLDLARTSAGPYVKFTIDTVQDRSYPLWGEQSFYVSVAPGEPMDPMVREFLRYILSRDAQELVQRDGKYLPLTAEVVRKELDKLE